MFESIVANFKQSIRSWSASGALSKAIQYGLASGESIPEELTQIVSSWGSDQLLELPNIQIASNGELKGHLGAYAPATKTLYLNPSLLDAPLTAEIVLTHEFGHYLIDNFYERHNEKNINRFVGTLIPSAYDIFDALNNSEANGSEAIDLPNGEKLSAEFFDTAIHNTLDDKLLVAFNNKSIDYMALGQNHCDDPIPTNRYGLQYSSAAHFDNNNIDGGLARVKFWYEDLLANFNATDVKDSKWNYVQVKQDTVLEGIRTGVGNFFKKAISQGDPVGAFANAASNIGTAMANGVAVALPDFADPNFQQGKINPAFTGENAGLELLLYRFGQINHALQDFYTHSNWTNLVGEANTGLPFQKDTILDAGYGLPTVLKPGTPIPGNQPGIGGKRQVMLASSKANDQYKRDFDPVVTIDKSVDTTGLSGGNTLSFQKWYSKVKDTQIFWRVNSELTSTTDVQTLKDPTLKATLKNGQDIFGLATGATWDLVYKDNNYSVPLIDANKVGMTTARALWNGFDHGGIAGTSNMLLPDIYDVPFLKARYNEYLGPLAKDNEKVPGHEKAMYYAVLQTRHEWDRLGNLIFAKYGEAGLDRFAKFALQAEYQQKYVDTYKVSGGKWTDWPQINSSNETFTYFTADYKSSNITVPRVDLRFINDVFYDAEAKGFTSKLQLQYSPADDGIDGNWTDSANTELYFKIDRHGDGLTDEIMQKLITPKPISHAEEVSRAFWTEDNNDDNSDGFGTIYFIESRNPFIPIIIPSFNIGIDKIVFVDNDGKRVLELGDHWGDNDYKQGIKQAQEKHNVFINATPSPSKTDPVWLITKDQLSTANGELNGLTFSADSVFHDCDLTAETGQNLSFVGLESNAPFISLKDGKIVASSDVGKYSNQEFLATVKVTDLAGGLNEDMIRIVVDPFLTIKGYSDIKSGQLFDITFDKQDSQIKSIYTAIDINNGLSEVESFTILSSVSGSINGNPNGYNPLRQRVKIGDSHDAGNVKFYLSNSQNPTPIELQVSKDEQGLLVLRNNTELVATLAPIDSNSPINTLSFEVDRFSLINSSSTVAGLRTDAPVNKGFVLNYTTYSSASYQSKIGFYLTDVRYGTIVDPLTGHMASPNLQELASTINQFKVFESDIVQNNASGKATFKLDSSIDTKNIIFTPYILTDTGTTTYLYGPDASLNPDGRDHISKIGNGLYGFEDMLGGGDNDFNDILFSFNSIQSL